VPGKNTNFLKYDLHNYATKLRNTWSGGYIYSSIAEKLAARAFRAVEGLLFTKAKKVRYKSKNQFKTIEGKNNTEGLMWKETGLKYKDLFLPGVIDSRDPVINYALTKRVKYW
jgi:putative transposase